MWSLTGQMYITTELQMDMFTQYMEPWMTQMHYKILPAKNQEEEMVTIGFLARACYSLYREDLRRAIIGHPLWKADDPFIFTLHHKTFLSPGKATQMLFCIDACREIKSRSSTNLFL